MISRMERPGVARPVWEDMIMPHFCFFFHRDDVSFAPQEKRKERARGVEMTGSDLAIGGLDFFKAGNTFSAACSSYWPDESLHYASL